MADLLDFEKLFQFSPGLLLVLDQDLKIVAVTEAYLNATLTTRQKILGKGIFEAFPDNPGDKEATGVSNLRTSLQEVLQSKSPNSMAIQKYSIRIPETEDFEVRYWSPLNFPVLDQHNEIEYIIHRVEDVTEFVHLKESQHQQKEINSALQTRSGQIENEIIIHSQEIQMANKQLLLLNKELTDKSIELKRSNEELDQFASIAAHDIQAPFRSVGMSLDLIEQLLDSKNPEVEKLFKRIKDARERIKNLIHDLLEFARASQQPQPFKEIKVQKIIEDVFDLIGDAKAAVRIEEPLPSISCDYSQMVQLFQNLLINAVKFQNTNAPEVVIASEEEPDFYKFTIKDNGIGIEEKYFGKIFQVFQRLHTKEQFPGTGLGLAICKKIVERHGGKIWVESQLGKGTSLCFTISKKKS